MPPPGGRIRWHERCKPGPCTIRTCTHQDPHLAEDAMRRTFTVHLRSVFTCPEIRGTLDDLAQFLGIEIAIS
jgi:hypothetical protein